VYSNGESEEVLGRALRDFANRDEIVLATKVWGPVRRGPNGRGLSRKHILSEVDKSLRRLGTDYIDLYIIHRYDYDTPLEETLEALNDVVRAGKVRYLGASSMHAVAVHESARRSARQWVGAVRLDAELLQPDVSRRRTGDAAALPV
jgi:aryl-alcohol dehydrogenase-like predicted oxidoreductase